MQEKFLIGLDLGTTNIKGVLVSTDGNVIKKASSASVYDRKPGGIVEYDAEAYFHRISEVLKELAVGEIAGISMVSASGNTVLLDSGMVPLRFAINWMDRRFGCEAEKVLKTPYDLYKKTGWPFFNTFPLSHLSWLKLNEPDNFNNAHKVCMVTDYVNYRLTGNLATNPSTATTFYLSDQKKNSWAPEILCELGLNEDMLPEIIPSGNIIGRITKAASELTGLRPGTPVAAGSFDHPGAARGLGILTEGELLLSCGTSWVGFYPSKSREKLISLNMLIDPFLKDKGCWGGMFSLPAVGNNIDSMIRKWISDKDDRYEKFNIQAKKSLPGANGLSINPMDDVNRDLSEYKKSDISRAIMEGTAFLMKDRISEFAQKGLSAKRIIMAGGPTHSELWLEILCDILEIDIMCGSSHAGAKGAAILAGIGAGIYKNEYEAIEHFNTGD